MRITSGSGNARVGEIETARGTIRTPFFMPVATKGMIKFMSPLEIKEMGYDCMISNALVNYFSPGLDIISKAGGLHSFIGWDNPIVTDSGGFQLLSESFLVKTTSEGAVFKNPFGGRQELITPEKLLSIQEALGSDIAMVLDDVMNYGEDYDAYFRSMVKTHEWARRQAKARKRKGQLLFGICQGGFHKDLREHSAKYVSALGLDGIALGGLAIGEPVKSMYDMIGHTMQFLPKEKPRYLMGVGNPADIVKSVQMGVDMFDSTFPTRNARHNSLFTFNGIIRIKNAKYKADFTPLEDSCDCFACQNYTKAFIRHLMVNKDPMGLRLSTIHNIRFMGRLMERIRSEIHSGSYDSFVDRFLEIFK